MSDSFFTRDAAIFRPTAHCRGPWSADACHAGPPTGLMVRALEQQLPDLALVRVTVELRRPIPFAGFTIRSETRHSGRSIGTTHAELIDQHDRLIATAAGLHQRRQPPVSYPTIERRFGTPEEAKPGSFPLAGQNLHDLPCFNTSGGVDIRYPAGQDAKPGPTVAWMRTVPLLPDEPSSPFQRICPLADCGNAFGRNADPGPTLRFLNTDLTIMLFRDPVGDWLGMSALNYWHSNGTGLSDAELFDQQGMLGRAVQTLWLQSGPVC